MKRIAKALFCLVLVTPGALTFQVKAADKRAPTIEIAVLVKGCCFGTDYASVDGQGGGLGTGSAQGSKGEIFHARDRERVLETSPGHFAVQVHYEIYVDAAKKTTVVDRTLPVLAKPLEPQDKGWIIIGPEIKTAAYFTGGTIAY